MSYEQKTYCIVTFLDHSVDVKPVEWILVASDFCRFSFIGGIECMRCRLFFLMFAVSVCLSVCLSVMRLELVATHAVYAMCCVHGVIVCNLCQITLTTCSFGCYLLKDLT